MKKLIFDPQQFSGRMTIVCFISGSGTNYREIVAKNREHDYLVFTNRPGCPGTIIAKQNNHEIIELSHWPYLKEAKRKYGSGMTPRNSDERIRYEQEVSRLIENKLGKIPDLICLAGYDQWLTDWTVERYYPRILNVHPGDTTKSYDGLHWVPTAKAIIAGDESIRSTLFFVDKGEDTGPILMQSAPLNISGTLDELEARGSKGLLTAFRKVTSFIKVQEIISYDSFIQKADEELKYFMELICSNLQDALKIAGDWQIYPVVVHDFISKGRVEVDDRNVYIDQQKIPPHGLRLVKHRVNPSQ